MQISYETKASDSKIFSIFDKSWRDENLDWQPYSSDGRSNVDIVRLYDDRRNGVGPAGALLRYAPGASVPAHLHPGTELILVLEGELINDAGVHPAGTLEICAVGSIHTLSSKKGCIFLVIWEQPVQRLDE
ncbi:cupin domain-containing protein [Pollutimonas bauzanensis]|uniref:ChrR Cupin-like domain-containing protein n=1 Tax=Pollutimonas bauzanensis TaxID=658167 RepID=A0A1M5MR67_9BURK|nr:cupin domain-containing protein [Pollutimonas bauzanensis]SHG79717.1 ChrR Cupin-like domain-containing protein [Pollutimonas bauzanensis]